MSRNFPKPTPEFARVVASSPAVAGFRPAGAALAVAAAFGLQPVVTQAQPTGAQVVHGQAQVVRNGNNVVVTTRNGAGTRHSAIDWQSFSVPKGSTTRFNQPSAASTSINRVLGDDPSSIFGTLSSNGHLVLVNPAGIAVGKGALVDTAGFTASTLGMSDADALAGRLRFAGEGADLSVKGRILARKGDVVLIAPDVSTGAKALIESNGAAILAAGEKVEITGRGLEGIHLQVQARDNAALNLGRLEGDAVGIFAGTLTHTGRVAARAVKGEGGQVILQALGDNIVAGRIEANGKAKGQGGSIDVLGERVGLMAGTRIEANGGTGGGSVRIGGDYQGANADVPNAKRAYVDRNARIEADALGKGDGGRVIVWSDELTRFGGQISARGGKAGGDGGFAEVSGKDRLQYAGRADLRAPKGKVGSLLLDPRDVDIVGGLAGASNMNNSSVSGGQQFSDGGTDPGTITDGDLNFQLLTANVEITTATSSVGSVGGGIIKLHPEAVVSWVGPQTLSLLADNHIDLQGTINASNASSALRLSSATGNISQGTGSIITVGGLYAVAPQGSVNLHAGTNNVDTIAGAAQADFTFENKKALTIGSVTTAFGGGGSGINPGSAATGSSVDIVAAGTLSVGYGTEVRGGSVLLQSNGAAANVNILAATIEANSGELKIKAGHDLVINAVSGSAGLYGGESTYLEALAGSITVSGPTRIEAAYSGGVNIRATATGSGNGNVNLGSSTTVHGGYGPVQILAKGSILGDADVTTYGRDTGYVSLEAQGGTLSIGNVSTSSTSSGSYSIAKAGTITIKGDGDVTTGGLYAGQSPSYGTGVGATISISSTGGNITLQEAVTPGGLFMATANNGSVTASNLVVDGNYYDAHAGEIVVEARGNIQVGGVSAYGRSWASSSSSLGAGDGGNITMTSTRGNIELGWVDASGGSAASIGSGTGGKIVLKAQSSVAGQGNVSVGGIRATGGYYYDYSSPVGTAGRGGVVEIHAHRDIRIGDESVAGGIDVSGGSVSYGSGAGAAGGEVSLLSKSGNVTAANRESSIRASGGSAGYDADGEGLGGRGGIVLIEATGGSVTLPHIEAAGGLGYLATGGRGGDVTIIAKGDITLQPEYGFSIVADGGQGQYGKGGRGGVVTLQSTAGSIIASSGGVPDMSGSMVGFSMRGEAPPEQRYSGISATGGRGTGIEAGTGRSGGDGGEVALDAATDVRVQAIDVRGGEVTYEGQRVGGNGGSASVRFGGVLELEEIRAFGGWSGPGYDTMSAGTGGKGGKIHVERRGGDFRVTSAYLLDARGGQGGAHFSESSGAAVAGGMGGAGGSVQLASTGGRVLLVSPNVMAGGGLGGLGDTGEESSRGAAGAQGTFSATGTSVEVQGNFLLDARWLNDARVNVRGASQVSGPGSFTNRGEVNLYGTSSLAPDGGVRNLAKGRLRALGTDVYTNLTENYGKVEVAAAAKLTAPAFRFNAGTLQVDGRLAVGTTPASTGPSAAAITSSGFTNDASGLITGTGTIALDGGVGVLQNFGTIAPAGSGPVGMLTIDGGLMMHAGSTLAIDIAEDRSHDVLRVTGNATSGGAIAVRYRDKANFREGDAFDVLQSATLDATTQPTLNVSELTAELRPDGVVLVANTSVPAPPPPPAPSPAPSQPDVPGGQQVNNQVVQFAQLFVREALAQQEEESRDNRLGKDDIVITDTQCKP